MQHVIDSIRLFSDPYVVEIGLNSTMRFSGILILLLALSQVGCGRTSLQFNDVPVIIITIDTLRSDHLRAYGYADNQTPCLDQLAQESLVFDRAYAHAPLTFPSHASLMTGTWPPYHGGRDNFGYRLEEKHTTLAEHFKAQGYRTGAVVSSMVLRSTTGIEQGFDDYDDRIKRGSRRGIVSYAERLGADSISLAKNWLDQQEDGKFFFWLHLYDPHAPYSAPGKPAANDIASYDGEIEYVDGLLNELFARLKELGFYDRAILVLTSDHGEGLGEHGEQQHGLLVYRETLQVPLMIRLPGAQEAATRRAEAVGLSDVATTVSELSGLEPLGDGVNLVSGKIPADRMIFAESINAQNNFGWFPQRSVISGSHHYIQGADELLFDLATDFHELSPLSDPIPSDFRDLVAELETIQHDQVEVSEEDTALLQSLGYVGGIGADQSAQDLSEADFLSLFNLVAESNHLLNDGRNARVESLLAPVVEKFPGMIDARLGLGAALFNQGKYEQAERLHLESLAMSPKNLTTLVALIETELALKKPEAAKPLVEKAVDLAPTLAARQLLPVMSQYDLFPLAKKVAEKALRLEPDYAFAYVILARSAVLNGHWDQVDIELDKARSHNDGDVFVSAMIAYTQADAAARSGDPDAAISAFGKALEVDPNHPASRTGLSLLLFSLDRGQQAIDNLNQWLEGFPTSANFEKAAQLCEVVGFADGASYYRSQAQEKP